MKKFLKSLLTLVGVLAAAVVVIFIIAGIMAGKESRELKRQGFSEEEVRLAGIIKLYQREVDKAAGKEPPEFVSFTHLTEVLDEDGTLLGYSMDGKTGNGTYAKRYFFTTEKKLLWWTNVTDSVDEEGRQHLRSGDGW